jgi:hypothetical protein
MTDFNITKARNFPLNRDGETLAETGSEGDLVGLSEDVDGNAQLVQADADSAVAQHAIGVLAEEVQDPTDVNVSGFEYADNEQRKLRREVTTGEYTLVGDQGSYIFNGVMLSDVDEATNFDAGEPVYLGVGGGFTQTAPSGAGEVVQRVGVAVEPGTVLLDVDFEYSTA